MVRRFSRCTCLFSLTFVLVFPVGRATAQTRSFDSSPISSSGSQYAPAAAPAGRPLIFRQLFDDLVYLAGERDFLFTVGAIGLAPSALPSAFDRESPEFTELWGASRFADELFDGGEVVGDGAFPVLVSATSYGVGKLTGSSRLRDFGTDLFRAQAATGLMTAVLKGSVNRTRPDGTPYSYPSGHTSSAFATAGVIYAHFGKTWGIPAFAFAGYVGLSRLQEGKHFFSDVVAGGILGTYISLKLVRKQDGGGRLLIAPSSVGDGMGMSVSLRF